jgi:hypothetical protein
MIANELTLQEEYDNYVIVNRIHKNREHRNVMARFAFMVAAREIYNTLQIARVMKKNHATVIHAWKQHEINVKFDRQYLRYYNQSCAIIDKIRKDEEDSPEYTLRKENAKLLERLQIVREELLETRNKLYIREEENKQLKKQYELCD